MLAPLGTTTLSSHQMSAQELCRMSHEDVSTRQAGSPTYRNSAIHFGIFGPTEYVHSGPGCSPARHDPLLVPSLLLELVFHLYLMLTRVRRRTP